MKATLDRLTTPEWNGVLGAFADASIYQAQGYSEARWGKNSITHFILEDAGEIIAAALVRNVKSPLLKGGLAYVSMGPMWRPKGRQADPDRLAIALAALRKEVVEKQGIQLRVRPRLTTDDVSDPEGFIAKSGFKLRPEVRPYQSLLVDLRLSEEELMASFHAKWRNHLSKGLKGDCEVVISKDLELFDRFVALHQEMADRKNFVEGMDLEAIRKAQTVEIDSNKLIVFAAKINDEIVATTLISWMGDTAIYLLGASGPEARKLNASYVLQWSVLQNLKQWKCTWYDLGGINPQGNPGVLEFKQRLAGKRGMAFQLVGEIEAKGGLVSQVMTQGVDWILKART